MALSFGHTNEERVEKLPPALDDTQP